jgi:hypothetical protein
MQKKEMINKKFGDCGLTAAKCLIFSPSSRGIRA